MREEHRRMRDEGWGPPPRPGRPERPGRGEWGPDRPGRGPGRGRGEREREHGHGRGGHEWSGPGPFGPPFGPEVGPGFGPGFGPGGFGPGFGKHGFGPRTRSRARRGDVRAAILDLLAEGEPWNGYQIIREIAERTSGVWRPSAGSVYPSLQQLEDEGLISPEGEGRRRMYTLTDEGRAYAEAHADELRSSWDAAAGMTDEIAMELQDIFRQVMMAVMEVRRAGSASQIAEARRVLTETRRAMYRILADDEGAPAGAAGAAQAPEPQDGEAQDDADDTGSSAEDGE
jgi:DNA-binding PadR family transcriptional regulator